MLPTQQHEDEVLAERRLGAGFVFGLGLFALWLGVDSLHRMLTDRARIAIEAGSLIALPLAWGLVRAAWLLWRPGSVTFWNRLVGVSVLFGIGATLVAAGVLEALAGAPGREPAVHTVQGLVWIGFGFLQRARLSADPADGA